MSGPDAILRCNLDALADHHPHAAAILEGRVTERAASGYRVGRGVDGRPVVGHDDRARTPGGPEGEARLREAMAQPRAAAVAGVGDGRVLGLLSPRPAGPQGATQVVYLCEPDADRLLAALSLADLTAPDGPIASGSVRWFVGDDWHASYADALASNQKLPAPDIRVRLGAGPEAEARWNEALAARQRARRDDARAAGDWAGSLGVPEIDAAFSGLDDRARVLLIAPRFTTVVRHSVAGAARGFRAMGWDARVCTEDADHERLCAEAVVAAVAAFRPHLIVAVNHHRHHFEGVPEGVPFVCWIQDDMLHLIKPGAGDRLGERDFVMSAWAHRYALEWGYPADRCVTVPRMTGAGAGAIGGVGSGASDEMVYVSSHSGVPEEILGRLIAGVGTGTAHARAAARTGRALIDLYGSGGSLADTRVLRGMLRDAARAEGVHEPEPGWLTKVTELLSLHLNNPLYRQQGLAWAARVAASRGLTLSVYGPGWDRHPTLAPHARGPVAYGDDLDRVTRNAAFNLRLEPYPAMCHQRLIDAIAAGGFVLSRRVSAWEEPEAAYASFFLEHLAGRAENDRDAIGLLNGEQTDEWRRLTDGLVAVFPQMRSMDVTAHHAKRLREGTMADYIHSAHPPRYFETVFNDEAGLAGLVDRFMADPGERESVVRAQRASVVARCSYEAGLRIVLEAINERIQAGRLRPVGGAA